MTPNPPSPTLADEFEAFVTSDDEYGDQEFGQFCRERYDAILAKFRSPDASGEHARGRAEALRDAAAAADDGACWSCRGCKTFSTRILALPQATAPKPAPGQGELRYYTLGPDADRVCQRCEFNLSADARDHQWVHDQKRDEAVQVEREEIIREFEWHAECCAIYAEKCAFREAAYIVRARATTAEKEKGK